MNVGSIAELAYISCSWVYLYTGTECSCNNTFLTKIKALYVSYRSDQYSKDQLISDLHCMNLSLHLLVRPPGFSCTLAFSESSKGWLLANTVG